MIHSSVVRPPHFVATRSMGVRDVGSMVDEIKQIGRKYSACTSGVDEHTYSCVSDESSLSHVPTVVIHVKSLWLLYSLRVTTWTIERAGVVNMRCPILCEELLPIHISA